MLLSCNHCPCPSGGLALAWACFRFSAALLLGEINKPALDEGANVLAFAAGAHHLRHQGFAA